MFILRGDGSAGMTVCGAAADRGGDLSAARTAVAGLPGRCGGGSVAGPPAAVSALGTRTEL